jgi:uncharacterized membrane protein YfcA
MALGATLFVLGLIGGLVSGLVGLGGGIIMVPLLLYVPPALSVGALSMKVVAGITSVQSFFGAVSGAVGHKRHRRISRSLALTVGGSMAVGSLVGSVASASLSFEVMLGVFATMAVAAAVMMLLPKAEDHAEPDAVALTYNRALAITIGGSIGILSGVVGQGGAFLFIPAMLYLLRIPTRIAIGTGLAVGIASSAAVLIGRAGTAQIPIALSVILVLGVILGAQLGSAMSQRTPHQALQSILSVLIDVTAIKIWYELLIR